MKTAKIRWNRENNPAFGPAWPTNPNAPNHCALLFMTAKMWIEACAKWWENCCGGQTLRTTEPV
jgi:hypothetical protein